MAQHLKNKNIELPQAVTKCIVELANETNPSGISSYAMAGDAFRYALNPGQKAGLGVLLGAIDGGRVTDKARQAFYNDPLLRRNTLDPQLRLSPDFFIAELREKFAITHALKEIYNAANGTCGEEAQLGLPVMTPVAGAKKASERS